jgi:hypothetical protein
MMDSQNNPFSGPDLSEEKSVSRSFGDFRSDVPEQVAMTPEEKQPKEENPFGGPDLSDKTSIGEAVGYHAAVNAVPGLGSLPAAGAGAMAGAAAGAPLGPIGSAVGGLAGGLVGGFGGAYALGKAQELALSPLPHEWRDPLEQKLKETELDIRPLLSSVGAFPRPDDEAGQIGAERESSEAEFHGYGNDPR